jgi:hypothetical protein
MAVAASGPEMGDGGSRVSAGAAVGAFVALAVNFATGNSIPFAIYLIVLLGWITVLGRRMAAQPSVLTP